MIELPAGYDAGADSVGDTQEYKVFIAAADAIETLGQGRAIVVIVQIRGNAVAFLEDPDNGYIIDSVKISWV